MKNFKLGNIKMSIGTDGFPKGLILKRKLNLRESRYILKNLLEIDISDKDCFYTKNDFDEYNNELNDDVNKWLKGDLDDYYITGMMDFIQIASYLKKKEIID